MICHVCDQDRDSGFLTPIGFACDACHDENKRRWRTIVERERELPIDDGPEEYDLAEFERFALRLAVHYLDAPGVRDTLWKANPMLCCPSELSMAFKERIIAAAPQHFSTWEARGHERLFHGGTYRLINTIPKDAAIDAAIKAGILRERTEA